MDEKSLVVPGETCRLLICLETVQEKWRKKTVASFRIYNDNSVVSIQANIEDLSQALLNDGGSPFRVFRGVLSEDFVVIDVTRMAENRAFLTVICGGSRCLSSVFPIDALQSAVSDLCRKNKQ